MLSGHVFRRQMWAPAIGVIGGGALRTPTVGMVNQDRSQDPQYMSKLLAKGQTVTLAAQMKSAQMLPTPRANDAEKRGNFDPHNPRNGLPAAVRLLPTPKASDGERGRDLARARPDIKGRELATVVRDRMLPTPTVNDAGNSTLPPSLRGRSSLPGAMLSDDSIPTGAATYLNPSFVEEMMGFPVGWTV